MTPRIPELLAFLEKESDQTEFLRVASIVGLGESDVELLKLLIALQLYKAFYADIPRQIKLVHEDALAEIQRLRDETEAFADRASADATRIGQWAEKILRALQDAEPSKVASAVHRRLMDETIQILSGSLQALRIAESQLETATSKMNRSAIQAESAIVEWQTMSLRQIWTSAFCTAFGVVAVIAVLLWLAR